MAVSPADVTGWLVAWSNGDEAALHHLVPLVEAELHRLARRSMAGERSEHTLQTTALVNEAYLRLVDADNVRWQNRAHFFAISTQVMRRILVDHARSRQVQKRGGGVHRVSLDAAGDIALQRAPDLVALDDALTTLSAKDQRKGRVVELRFFGGLSVQETAEVLQVSVDTVMRDWQFAKAWLARELGGGA